MQELKDKTIWITTMPAAEKAKLSEMLSGKVEYETVFAKALIHKDKKIRRNRKENRPLGQAQNYMDMRKQDW
jgi:IS5 family transposase